MTAFLVGVALAVVVGAFAIWVGFERERSFYPTVTIVIAILYVLFAVMGGSTQALLVELLVASAFIVAAVLGFRSSMWIVVGALAAHGLQDFVHGDIIDNPGTPPWWPAFCGAYDVAAAAWLGRRLKSVPALSRPGPPAPSTLRALHRP